jgi:hypothetical protein
MKRFKGCLGVFLIFFLGVIVGAILASGAIYAKVWELIEGGPDKVAEFTIKRLKDELKLDDVQKREFERIADRTRLKLRAVRYNHQPEVQAVLDESDRELRAILTPKQQAKFADLMRRFRDRWRIEETDLDPAKPAPVPSAPATPAPTPVEPPGS